MKTFIYLLGTTIIFYFFSGCAKKEKNKTLGNIETVKSFMQDDTDVIYFTAEYQKKIVSKDTESKTIKEYPKIILAGRTYYLCEGDLLIEESEFGGYLEKWKELNLIEGIGSKLIGMVDKKGRRVRWAIGSELIYSVQKNSFDNEEHYNLVVQNMLEATNEWGRVCNIKFKYLASNDDNPDTENLKKTVTFVVTKSNESTDIVATSFFPNDPEYKRVLYVYPEYFNTEFNKIGVFRHEIGHIIGFRHEHIRAKAPLLCRDLYGSESTDNTINLTEYDRNSVMHYLCGKFAGNYELSITDKDIRGARILYDSLAK